MLPWEVDFSWLIIRTMQMLKIASRVNVAKPPVIQTPAAAPTAPVSSVQPPEATLPLLTVSSAIPFKQRAVARVRVNSKQVAGKRR
jgi:hypothetical protein